MSGVVDDVDEQTEKPIDQVLPTGRIASQATIHQFAINFGEGHNSFPH